MHIYIYIHTHRYIDVYTYMSLSLSLSLSLCTGFRDMDCVFCAVFCAVLGPPCYGSQHMGRHSKICNAPVKVPHFWKVVFLRQILVHGWLQRIGVHVHVELGESSKH